MLEYKGKKFVCHIDFGMEIIRGKWKGVILCHLNDGPKRFLELHRITKGVSQKVLIEKLSELESDGLVHKEVFDEVPPRVEYSLTNLGKELFPALDLIQQWAIKHYSDLSDNAQ